ncbi:bifunctional DNA-formamidopyrimidine glycosylase/DNA-(apurinic or apyrimidinic site) lyase [Oleisolibacter albus]|uniref:bifunctional DNA-formamidopyrimidine glycosylase/DNA-(apurinic or apyrimidinic site) lyase n=1 Tax=Oleisolibacter albus TaxID=2171757 RepID=UPI000DF1FC32|nr:bifunctional DNA-formamidopyrimidine glycosylase/DNA-(apurinic or apyrimidinic site) lyase [Oleisolibacter albus]
MPELPEVETVRRGLAMKLEGRVLKRVRQYRPDLRFPLPADFATRMTGRRVLSLDRRAKYILARLDDGMVWMTHLGMSGSMVVKPGPAGTPAPHDHLVFETDDGWVVTYNDVRRFGFMDLIDEDRLDSHPLLASLGPEPLGNGFNATQLSDRLAGKVTPIKAALLDQTVVAGLGNIYVCESLFRAGIDPTRPAQTVAGADAERLVPVIRQVLTEAIAAGGSTLRDFVQSDGELGYFQHSFTVYGREGQPCPGCTCDMEKTGGIARIVQSGRSTFYCPRRQR